MKIVTRIVLILVALLVIYQVTVMVAFTLNGDDKAKSFERLAFGEDKFTVTNTFGTPDTVGKCIGEDFGENPNTATSKKCVEWWRYEKPGAIVGYGVGFNNNGKVVQKYRYVSE
jgi:hypothetical protein